MALPYRTTGSLRPSFDPARLVRLAVKHPYAFTLVARCPTALRVPLCSSVTLSEETAPVKLPTMHCPWPRGGPRLELRIFQGGISRMTPPGLAPWLHRLPPILHKKTQSPVQSCSKGSRGLSVLPREHCIFTANSISLGLGWRQSSHRYAIRAGRNLPDKEFRYLRTVIVTAAVYRGFDQELRAETLTPSLNLPAPGRRHTLYFLLRVCRVLCF
jgi:hypothetical protein